MQINTFEDGNDSASNEISCNEEIRKIRESSEKLREENAKLRSESVLARQQLVALTKQSEELRSALFIARDQLIFMAKDVEKAVEDKNACKNLIKEQSRLINRFKKSIFKLLN